MSPRQYNDEFRSYAGAAGQFGHGLTKAQFAYAIRNNVDLETFRNRVGAVRMVQDNPDDFNQFKLAVQDAGIKSKVTTTDLYDFAMRQKDATWTKIWDDAAMRSAAVNAGLGIGTDITKAQLMHLMNIDPSLELASSTSALLGDASKIMTSAAAKYQDSALKAGLSMTGQSLSVENIAEAQEGVGDPNSATALARAQATASARAQDTVTEKLGAGLNDVVGPTQAQTTSGVTAQMSEP
jgi:hypothetical protein